MKKSRISSRPALPFLLAGALGAVGCSSAGDPGSEQETATDATTAAEGSTSSHSQPPTTTTSTAATETGAVDTDGSSSSGIAQTTGEGDPDAAQDLVDRLVGLWVAPVTSWTSVGSFPTMNMDFRRAGDALFARVDLDANNALRFAFAKEDHGGAPVLVYRNGGKFLGLDRDTRTELVESDAAAGHWRFCALQGGCDYVDATFDFSGEENFTLAVAVMGMNHILWEARRREERELTDRLIIGEPLPGDAPFAEMPTLHVELSWNEPLEEDAEAWVILSTTACGFTASCVPSRFLRVETAAGTTSATLVLEQIHPGTYKANAMLDRNGNLAGTLFPDAGDRVAVPDQNVVVAPRGDSDVSIALVVDL